MLYQITAFKLTLSHIKDEKVSDFGLSHVPSCQQYHGQLASE